MSQFELPEMKLLDLGIAYDHNHPCCVCREKHSVLDLSIGVMAPCRECEKIGWRVIYWKPSLVERIVNWFTRRFE